MPAERLSMRKTKEILRPRWGLGRSLRDTGLSCGVAATIVHDVIARATAAGLSWPLAEDLDDGALERRLYPPLVAVRDRALPDVAAVYRELKRRGVTAITVPDNLRAGVTKPDFYEPELNPAYREMAALYATAIIPARVRHPKDKARQRMPCCRSSGGSSPRCAITGSSPEPR